MQVILRSDVDGLGTTGDVLDVADGYARNYLVPKGLAMVSSCSTEIRCRRLPGWGVTGD